MMQEIRLTGSNGDIFRVSPDHLVAYGPRFDRSPGSEVIFSIHNFGQSVAVKESPEDIDRLLMEIP